MSDKPHNSPKKSYTNPVLRVYGDIEAVTQLNAKGTKVDSAKGLNKTA
jgi:hypothetical protein